MRTLRNTPHKSVPGLVLLALLLVSLTTTLVPPARVAAAPSSSNSFAHKDLAFAWPYTKFVQTQGPHGASYGDYAYDLAAGRIAPVLSPINGEVTKVGTDGLNNVCLHQK